MFFNTQIDYYNGINNLIEERKEMIKILNSQKDLGLKKGQKIKGRYKGETFKGKVVKVFPTFAYIQREDNKISDDESGKYENKYYWQITRNNNGVWLSSHYALIDFEGLEPIEIL